MLLWTAGTGLIAGPADAQAELQSLGDPFVQVTSALAACPPARPTLYTPQEVRAQSHYRVERGTSCYQSGRCRLPNAYAYDREIIDRVQKFIAQDPRFASSSLWIEGQRRWVFLRGCVSSEAQKEALVAAVATVDEVENVVAELSVIP